MVLNHPFSASNSSTRYIRAIRSTRYAFVLFAVLSIALTSTSGSHGQDTRSWIDPTGGFFELTSNWSDGMTPGSNDGARFDLDADYSVTWDALTADRVNNRLEISSGNVTFLANPGGNRTYSIAGTGGTQQASIRNGASLTVGGPNTGTMNLIVGDRLTISGIASPLQIGRLNVSDGSTVTAGSLRLFDNSELYISSGGILDVNMGRSVLGGDLFDVRGAGSAFTAGDFLISTTLGPDRRDVVIADGATFEANDVIVDFSRGTFGVRGAGSVLTVDNIYSSGPGSALSIGVFDGGRLTAGLIDLGNDPGSFESGEFYESVTVGDVGSRITANRMNIGSDGDATAVFRDEAIADIAVMFVGVGNNGFGQLNLSNSAILDTNLITIGGQSGDGRVVVESSTINAGQIVVGDTGSLSIDTGTGGQISIINTQRLEFQGGAFNLKNGIVNVLSSDSTATLNLSGETLSSELLLSADAQLHVAGQTVFGEGTNVRIIDTVGLSSSRVTNHGNMQIFADLTLGSTIMHDGFGGTGTLQIDSSSLTLLDKGFAELGSQTTLTNSVLNAANGVALGSARVIEGFGSVNGRIAASTGSAIYATNGDLSLGDADHVAGYSSQGELYVGENLVTILDANQASLGTYTELGLGSVGGTLNIANGAILEFGDNLIGVGRIENGNSIATAIINNGAIIGNSPADRLVVTGYVKGIGTFDNVQFDGTFAPGLSPTMTRGSNFFFGDSSVLEMEIGGLIPGDEHDAIWASGLLSLAGTLEVQLINGFDPTLGNSFDLLNWGSFDGAFDSFILPELGSGLRWDTGGLYETGVLRVSAVPEGGTVGFLSVFLAGCFASRRRNRNPIPEFKT